MAGYAEFGGEEWSAKILCDSVFNELEELGLDHEEFVRTVGDVGHDSRWILFSTKYQTIIATIESAREHGDNAVILEVRGIAIGESGEKKVSGQLKIVFNKPVANRVVILLNSCNEDIGYIADIAYAEINGNAIVATEQ